MKKKLFMLGILAVVLVISGCGNLNNYSQRDEVVDELDPTRNQEAPADRETQELNKKLGFVKYTRDQLKNEPYQNVTMDREKMADMITRIILRNNTFDEVATLVTDEDVLIAYQANDKIDEDNAAEIAKKTAMSVMPGYFDVYVSDNGVIMRDIQSLHNSTTENKNYDNYKDEIINEMKKSSQGFEENRKD